MKNMNLDDIIEVLLLANEPVIVLPEASPDILAEVKEFEEKLVNFPSNGSLSEYGAIGQAIRDRRYAISENDNYNMTDKLLFSELDNFSLSYSFVKFAARIQEWNEFSAEMAKQEMAKRVN